MRGGVQLARQRASRSSFWLSRPRGCSARFLLGGNGWRERPRPRNVRYVGHVYTRDLQKAFNRSPLAVLNVNRESMARYGFSPPTRVFEAAGAAACVITDAWAGIESYVLAGASAPLAQEAAP